jgi:O-antigen ligase
VYLGHLPRAVWIPLFILGTVTILATQSRTVLLVVILACISQLPRRFLILILILMLGMTLAISIYATGDTNEIYRMIGRGGEAQDTLTMAGRTELWAFTERLIVERPWLGYGFNSFETYAPSASTGEDRNDVVGPHNNYLSLLCNGGIIGAIPWIAVSVILLYRWFAMPFLPRDLFIIMVLLTGFPEVNLPNNLVIPTLSFFVLIAMDARRCTILQARRNAMNWQTRTA